jgi:hypothetical protein
VVLRPRRPRSGPIEGFRPRPAAGSPTISMALIPEISLICPGSRCRWGPPLSPSIR